MHSKSTSGSKGSRPAIKQARSQQRIHKHPSNSQFVQPNKPSKESIHTKTASSRSLRRFAKHTSLPTPIPSQYLLSRSFQPQTSFLSPYSFQTDRISTSTSAISHSFPPHRSPSLHTPQSTSTTPISSFSNFALPHIPKSNQLISTAHQSLTVHSTPPHVPQISTQCAKVPQHRSQMINSTSPRAFSTGSYKMNWKGSSKTHQSLDLEYNKKKEQRQKQEAATPTRLSTNSIYEEAEAKKRKIEEIRKETQAKAMLARQATFMIGASGSVEDLKFRHDDAASEGGSNTTTKNAKNATNSDTHQHKVNGDKTANSDGDSANGDSSDGKSTGNKEKKFESMEEKLKHLQTEREKAEKEAEGKKRLEMLKSEAPKLPPLDVKVDFANLQASLGKLHAVPKKAVKVRKEGKEGKESKVALNSNSEPTDSQTHSDMHSSSSDSEFDHFDNHPTSSDDRIEKKTDITDGFDAASVHASETEEKGGVKKTTSPPRLLRRNPQSKRLASSTRQLHPTAHASDDHSESEDNNHQHNSNGGKGSTNAQIDLAAELALLKLEADEKQKALEAKLALEERLKSSLTTPSTADSKM